MDATDEALAAAQEIVDIAVRDRMQVPYRDTMAEIIDRHTLARRKENETDNGTKDETDGPADVG